MTAPFVLVHGAWHAGACWQPLVDELTTRGEGAVAAFYHDVPEERLDAATDALRLQQWGPTREQWPLGAYPDVPMRYVACADDRILDPDWQVRSARERLGLEPDVLHSSHSPMLAQPAALADLQVAPFSPAG